MQGHRRRQATKKYTATPVRPKGYGSTGSSTVLALLDNVQTLPASRRLASDPATPVKLPHLLLGQVPKVGRGQSLWGVSFLGLPGGEKDCPLP